MKANLHVFVLIGVVLFTAHAKAENYPDLCRAKLNSSYSHVSPKLLATCDNMTTASTYSCVEALANNYHQWLHDSVLAQCESCINDNCTTVVTTACSRYTRMTKFAMEIFVSFRTSEQKDCAMKVFAQYPQPALSQISACQ